MYHIQRGNVNSKFQLEAKIKENISAEYKELVVFSAEQEKFHGYWPSLTP